MHVYLDATERAGDRMGDFEVASSTSVRTGEFAAGHVPGADHVELGALGSRAGDLPAAPTGPQDWADLNGKPVEVGT